MKNHIDLNTTVSINSDILSTSLEDELVMLHMERGFYYGVDGVARYIWEQLEQPNTGRNLCKTLQQRYVVDNETAEREVLAFLSSLQAADLLTIHT